MNIILGYFYWQLIETPKKIILIIKDFIVFGFVLFSVKENIRNLFSPWKRYNWDYGRGFDMSRYFDVFMSNLITRSIGCFMRIFLLLFFVVYEFLTLIIGILLFLFFVFYPFIALWIIINLI
ncbi:MAG: hypothetical protein WC446_02110 [Candidatus Paceibacterota bacterium]|jgi:hypothetical protein